MNGDRSDFLRTASPPRWQCFIAPPISFFGWEKPLKTQNFMHSTVGVGLNFAFRVTNPLNFAIRVVVGMANLLLYGFRETFGVYSYF